MRRDVYYVASAIVWVVATSVALAQVQEPTTDPQGAPQDQQEPTTPEEPTTPAEEVESPPQVEEAEPAPLPVDDTGSSYQAPYETQTMEDQVEPEPEVQATVAPEQEEEVVITGSRIRRTNREAPTQVITITREDIRRSGATNMADVVKYLNLNSGSDFNFDFVGASQAPGTAQFNLRGLGLSATLVLLNGRRMVTSGSESVDGQTFVDVNTIPLSIIERIEILPSGASAVYGSDAVAGVVNIITRKDINGVEIQLGGLATDKFDQREGDVSLNFGTNIGNTRFLGNVSYFSRTPLDLSDRNFKLRTNTSRAGNPGTFAFFPTPTMPLMLMPDPACASVPGSAPLASGYCTFDYNKYVNLMIHEDRMNAFLTAEHDFSSHVYAFAEFGYARSRNQRNVAPSFPISQPLTIPGNHLDNPFGAPVLFVGRALGATYPAGIVRGSSDTFRAVAGVRGDFGSGAKGTIAEDWEWQASGTWSENRFILSSNDFLRAPLQTAINSCSDAGNLSGCFNPFYSAVDGTGTPNSQALLNRLIGVHTTNTVSSIYVADASLTGSLLKLPGGKLSFALGTQYRHEQRARTVNNDSETNAFIFLAGVPGYKGDRDIYSVYGELAAPIFRGFELQGAVRYENYIDLDQSVNPRAALSWAPLALMGDSAPKLLEKLRVRGSFSTAFRAPSVYQTDGGKVDLLPLTDTGATSATYYAVRSIGNPNLKSETAVSFTAGLAWEPLKDLNFSADFWQYDYKNIIVVPNAQQIILTDPMDPRLIRGTTGALQRVDVQFTNATKAKTNGMDFFTGYSFGLRDVGVENVDVGTFSVGVLGTVLLNYDYKANALTPSVEAAGKRNLNLFPRSLPRWRFNLPIAWSYKGHTLATIVRIISGYQDQVNIDPGTMNPRHVDSFTTWDLQYAYTLEHGLFGKPSVFRLGIINLLGTNPPAAVTDVGYDSKVADPRGRMLYARVTQEF